MKKMEDRAWGDKGIRKYQVKNFSFIILFMKQVELLRFWVLCMLKGIQIIY